MVQIRLNMHHILMEVSRIVREGKLPTTVASWEQNSSRDTTPTREASFSVSLYFSLWHVGLRIFAELKGSFERESESRNLRAVYYENRYTRVVRRRRITGSDGVHLPKRLNYQDRRVHPLVRASSPSLF